MVISKNKILRVIKDFPNPWRFQFFTGLVTLSETISSPCFVRQKGKVVTQDYTSTSPSVIAKNLFHCNVESKMEIGKGWTVNQSVSFATTVNSYQLIYCCVKLKFSTKLRITHYYLCSMLPNYFCSN